MTEGKKLGIWGHIRPLLCENGGGFSVGRIGLWVILIKCLTIWEVVIDAKNEIIVTDIPPYLFYTLVVFTLYNMYKKIPMFIKLIQAWKGTGTSGE